MHLGKRKDFPVSSIVKDLPIPDASCKLNLFEPQREYCTSVSKFLTALYILVKKEKKNPSKKQIFYLSKDIENISALKEPIS